MHSLRVEMGKRVLSSLPSVKIKQQNTTKKVLEAYSPQYLFSELFSYFGGFMRETAQEGNVTVINR